MWWSCSSVIILTFSCGLQPGECQFSVTTDPVPGVNGYFPGTQNITLVCQVNEGGSRRATSWSKQTALDREEGRGRRTITSSGNNFDPNFLLSSQENIGQFGIPDTSILTIVSLTEDLNTTIIFCGFEEPLANFTIRINYPPVLTDRGEVRRRENEELSMDMAEPGSLLAFPFPSQVSWAKDGEEVAGGSSTRVFNYSSIFIGSVQPSDSGDYVLSATNYQLNGGPLLGSATASLTLNVLFGARYSGPGSGTVAVVEGESATLVCGTGLSGNPLPTLTWTDNTGRVATAGGRTSLSTGREVVSLTLSSTRQYDTGYWNCSAQVYDGANVVGQSVGRDIRLVVVVPPVAPVDLAVKGIGATWIYLQWFNPSAGLGNPPLSSHVVRVQEVGGEVEERTFDSSEGEANVTDLLPGTQYILSAVAVSQFQDLRAISPRSNSDSGTTTLTVPAPVCSDVPEVEDTRLA
ncbi:Hemicentin-2 [Geodia barretti]|uniref:Hemicentin-2 n=1 Tax=Geodia barretti TaxID=519541 RepID=A0AA35TA82_GEOBA|nr:Hemicentin-2 [Geodia barretti]